LGGAGVGLRHLSVPLQPPQNSGLSPESAPVHFCPLAPTRIPESPD
jgi:hypothetical protein